MSVVEQEREIGGSLREGVGKGDGIKWCVLALWSLVLVLMSVHVSVVGVAVGAVLYPGTAVGMLVTTVANPAGAIVAGSAASLLGLVSIGIVLYTARKLSGRRAN
jgi:hypothetical protein